MSLKDAYRTALQDHRDAAGRIPFLVNDMVIEEQLCHLRCTYCLTEEFNLLMAVPDAHERLTTDRHDEWLTALDRYDEAIDAPILRLSGGELFWLPGSDAFVAEAAQRYETVQVITNGLLLKPDRLERLAASPNLQLNLSLDGHTASMNRHRFPNPKMLDVVLHHLDVAVALGMLVEIQTVLTAANTERIAEFCEFLVDRFGDRVRVYYFPVRGQVAGDLACPTGGYLTEVSRRYDELAPVLPPRAYVDHMADFVETGRRSLPCSIPATMLQLFGTGEMSACPHAWISPIGDLVADPASAAAIGHHEHYDLFLQPRPRIAFCRGCATPSDVVNLYLQGQVSQEEIAGCFLYRGPRSLERLQLLKQAFAPVLDGLGAGPRPRRSIPVRAE